jgi:hypothetical protein
MSLGLLQWEIKMEHLIINLHTAPTVTRWILNILKLANCKHSVIKKKSKGLHSSSGH